MDTNTKINTPLVSILMLTYNRAHFLTEAIDSVLNQSYQNWELIIIDDGSTDNTSEIVGRYTDSRINYIKHETNAGLFARRSESLTYIKGDYVAVLDSDDYWCSKTKLEEQIAYLVSNKDYVVVGTRAILIDEKGNKLNEHRVLTEDADIRRKILFQNQFVHSSLVMRSDVIRKTNGYQPVLGEDLELILQLGNFGKLGNLQGIHTAHRVHKNSENDHGKQMIAAVYNSITKHKTEYPFSLLARLLMRLRLFVYSIK